MGKASYSYYPIVTFRARNEQMYTFTSNFTDNTIQAGEKVRVLYNSSGPRSARIDSFGHLWGGWMLALVLGLVFGVQVSVVFTLFGIGLVTGGIFVLTRQASQADGAKAAILFLFGAIGLFMGIGSFFAFKPSNREMKRASSYEITRDKDKR